MIRLNPTLPHLFGFRLGNVVAISDDDAALDSVAQQFAVIHIGRAQADGTQTSAFVALNVQLESIPIAALVARFASCQLRRYGAGTLQTGSVVEF